MNEHFLNLCPRERTPIDLGETLTEIKVPDMESALARLSEMEGMASKTPVAKDLFEEQKRKAWDKSVEARCDFDRHAKMVPRAGIFFHSIWQKSVMGRTLTEIKADDRMIPFFAENMGHYIQDVLGRFLKRGSWCIITTPKRRHTTRNFATLTSIEIGKLLDIPFYEDVTTCRSRHRVGAIFDVQYLPPEQNIIVFDDFVTTGSTLASMCHALEPEGKNIVFFAGINNKL